MYRISNVTKKNLERSLGMSLDDFNRMSADEEQVWLEERMGKKLRFSKEKKKGIAGRGNPLLARRKIRTIDDLERKSHDIFGI